MGAIHGHRYCWIVVFESGEIFAPDFTRAEMAVIEFMGKVEMYALDVIC